MKKLLISLVLLSSALVFAKEQPTPEVSVNVFVVNNNTVNITKRYPATITAQKSVDIIAKVSGDLEKDIL